MSCGKDVSSDAEVDEFNGEGQQYCDHCMLDTTFIRYISQRGYIHWVCCSCCKDIAGSAIAQR